jgi:hypothetical protein
MQIAIWCLCSCQAIAQRLSVLDPTSTMALLVGAACHAYDMALPLDRLQAGVSQRPTPILLVVSIATMQPPPPPSSLLIKGLDIARRAVDLDPENPLCYALLARSLLRAAGAPVRRPSDAVRDEVLVATAIMVTCAVRELL